MAPSLLNFLPLNCILPLYRHPWSWLLLGIPSFEYPKFPDILHKHCDYKVFTMCTKIGFWILEVVVFGRKREQKQHSINILFWTVYMSLMISVWISSAIKFIKKCKILMEGLLNTFLTSIFCYINLSRPQNKDSMVPRYIYLECWLYFYGHKACCLCAFMNHDVLSIMCRLL